MELNAMFRRVLVKRSPATEKPAAIDKCPANAQRPSPTKANAQRLPMRRISSVSGLYMLLCDKGFWIRLLDSRGTVSLLQ